MTVWGAGSLSSPIVISDDVDEAFVELELERRLSSPQESVEMQFGDDFQDGYVYENRVNHHRSYQADQYMNDYPYPVAPGGHYTPGTLLKPPTTARCYISFTHPRNEWWSCNWT